MEVLKKLSHYPMFDGKYMWLVVMRLNLPGLQSLLMKHRLGWRGYLKVVCCIGQQIIIIIAGMYCIGQRKFVSLQQLVDHYQVYFQIQSSNQYLFLLFFFYPWMLKRMKSSTSFFPESSNLHVTKGGEAISDQTFGQVSSKSLPSHRFDLKPLLKVKQTPSQSEKLNSNFCCKVCPSKSGTQWRKLCNQNLFFLQKLLFCFEH